MRKDMGKMAFGMALMRNIERWSLIISHAIP